MNSMNLLKSAKIAARSGQVLGVLAVLVTLVGLYLTYHVPMDRVQGLPQKIFYIHVGFAWTAYLMVGILAVASVINMFKPNSVLAMQASASASEVALLLLTGVIITGPIWAKPIWGAWWSWDARLTTTFVLWLSLAVYNLLRSSLPEDSRSARMLAVLAIIAAADVPIIHYSVRWWRTMHPDPVVMADKVGGGLAKGMVAPMLVMLLAVTLWGLTLWVVAFAIRIYQYLKSYQEV